LKFMSGREIPNPCSQEWGQEVCQVLGMSIIESHSAWAHLQEMGLIVMLDGAYVLCDTEKLSPASVSSQDMPKSEGSSLYAQVEAQFGRVLSSSEVARLEDLAEAYSTELIVLAVQASVQEQALSMPYVTKVLADWKRRKLTTPEDITTYLDERKQAILSNQIVKGRRNARIPQVKTGDLMGYDDPELILKRMKQAARGED
ncbi:MAG: DnaD domain protein, partial [Bacillota bacterium]|nr:DnaD domain protein [Bacillota bacterium]